MSVIHPGSSINFDAATLRQNEDEEMIEEELRQQKELRELLSAELSDDLLDDDHSSVNDSHRSLPHDGSTEPQHDNINSPVITSSTTGITSAWMQQGNAGYNGNNSEPMTSTPGNPLQNQYYGRQINGYEYNGGHPYAHGNYPNNQQYYEPPYGQNSQQPDYGNEVMYQQQRAEGVGQYMHYDQGMGGQDQMDPRMQDNGEYPFSERGEVEGREDYETLVDGNHIQQQFVEYEPDRTAPVTTSGSLISSPGSKISYRQSYPPHNVQYGRGKSHHPYNQGYDNNSLHDISNGSTDFESREREKHLQKQFNSVTNDQHEETSRQMAQLQILYKARGKKIDELTRELDTLRSDSSREKRILSHQLAMAKDQKDGMGTSLEESQKLVQSRDREIDELKGKMEAQHAEVESLKSAKNELLTKIQVSERTIESLHEQLTQMSHSEAIERAKEQHDAVLNAATQRHEMQILELTTQLDECRQEMNEKSEEVDKLRFHLSKLSRESEQTLLDKTETINRLTKSLEEAQNQCQNLLAGSNDGSVSRHQLSDLVQERKQNEEEIAYLKMQLRDAEEHITLYENALQLGATGTASSRPHHMRGGSMSDSISELMNGKADIVKKLDWKTPQNKLSQSIEPGSQEELIDGLRRELERAISCNKTKRDQVTKLKQQCSELEDESRHWRTRADEAHSQLKLNISAPGGKAETERGDEDVAKDSLAIEELQEKLQRADDEIERLEQICSGVKQRMAEMIQEHDKSKQEAVDRCERACMQLHEDAKQALREELTAEHEQKMYEMSIEHDAKIREMSADMEQLQHELDDVKQSYVHICAEKDNIQSNCQQDLLEQFEQEKSDLLAEHEEQIAKFEKMLEDLREQMDSKIKEEREKFEKEWEKGRERIQEEVRKEWENKREKVLEEAREEWEKEREEEFAQQMETKIALAKMNWFEEHSSSKQKSVDKAVMDVEESWKQKLDKLQQEWNEKTRNEIVEERKTWNTEKENEMKKLRDELLQEKEVAVKTASCIAELNMNITKNDVAEQDLEIKLKEAQDEWMHAEEGRMREARESWEREQRMKIQQAEKRRNEEIENERKSHAGLVAKTTAEVRKACDQEKQKLIKQKCMEMDEEIKRLQEQHRKDYEIFVEDHKKTLAQFIEQEKMRSTPPSMRDAMLQVQILSVEDKEFEFSKKEAEWISEKRELLKKHEDEILSLRKKYEERCSELESEIQRSKTTSQIEAERATLEGQRDLSRLQLENEKLQGEVEVTESRLRKMKEQNKEDMERLKDRMREEYKRWKRERATLISKIKESAQPRHLTDVKNDDSASKSDESCKRCQSSEENSARLLRHKDEASKKAISQLSEMYAETLKMIKDEMMSYINESRGRTKETISRERKRTASKLRSHYRRAVQRIKPEKDVQDELLNRLKILDTDSDSRPDTPILITQRTNSTDSGNKTASNDPLAPSSGRHDHNVPQGDRFHAWRDSTKSVATRLTPERGPQTSGGASTVVRPSPHPQSTPFQPLPQMSWRDRPTIPATYEDRRQNEILPQNRHHLAAGDDSVPRTYQQFIAERRTPQHRQKYDSPRQFGDQLYADVDGISRAIPTSLHDRPSAILVPDYRRQFPVNVGNSAAISSPRVRNITDRQNDGPLLSYGAQFTARIENNPRGSEDGAKTNLLSNFQKYSQTPNAGSPLGGVYHKSRANEITPKR